MYPILKAVLQFPFLHFTRTELKVYLCSSLKTQHENQNNTQEIICGNRQLQRDERSSSQAAA